MNETNPSQTVEEQLITGVISIGINSLLLIVTILVKYIENNKMNKFLKTVRQEHGEIIEKLSLPISSNRQSLTEPGPQEPYTPQNTPTNAVHDHIVPLDTNRNLIIRKNNV